MQDVETKYRLFALSLNDDNVADAQRHRFSRITPFYLLIYTAQNEKIENAVEITEDEIDRLSSADRDWLLGCNITLVAEDAIKREKEISISLGEKIEQLEHALKTVKENQEAE